MSDNLIAADRIYIGVNPTTIFSDAVEVTSVELVRPKISLESQGDQSNWSFGDLEGGSAGASGGPAIAVRKITMSDGVIRVLREGAAPVEISAASGTLELGETGGADLNFTATYNGQPLSGTFATPLLASLMTGNGKLSTNLQVGQSSLVFDGQVSPADLTASGPLRLEMTDHASVFGLAGLTPPDLPQGFGKSRIGIIADLDINATRLTLSNLQMNLDQNHFGGSVRCRLCRAAAHRRQDQRGGG